MKESNHPESPKQTVTPSQSGSREPRHGLVAAIVGGIALGMVGMSYAAVPLYQLFCQVTGYGGTTKRAESAPSKVLDRTITVYFDANTSKSLPWKFKPAQYSMELKIGDTGLAYYKATNLSDKTVKGSALFNVTPVAAGSYFNKIECFCFTEQELKPGESVDMPVTFFIDPDFVKDPDTKKIQEITLSYTFFPIDGKPQRNKGNVAQGKPDQVIHKDQS